MFFFKTIKQVLFKDTYNLLSFTFFEGIFISEGQVFLFGTKPEISLVHSSVLVACEE